jgi:hypothetical protein
MENQKYGEKMTALNSQIILWQGPSGLCIPHNINNASQIINYGSGLKLQDKNKIIQAFNAGAFDMGAEFIWRRSMSRLRTSLATLGMKFIAEMLNREDIDEFSSPESVLNDYDTIRLAESLGMISTTGAMRLRHAFESISHFSSQQSDEELSVTEATSIVRACVQYVIGEKDIGVAIDFSRLRERLLSESLTIENGQVQQLLGSPPFFLRTALRVLIASIKVDKGAKLEHALGNLNLLLPEMWPQFMDTDKWSVGNAYAEISSSGNPIAVAGLKKALMKVAGFDFVPENLRSNTYKKAAQAVLSAHHSFGNFYAEIEPVRHLATLGTTIPQPALSECVQAFLCVYLGNMYGYSWNAASIAEEHLKKFTKDRWEYYLKHILHGDEIILDKLTDDKPATRFCDLADKLKFDKITFEGALSQQLIEATCRKKTDIVKVQAKRLLTKFKGS